MHVKPACSRSVSSCTTKSVDEMQFGINYDGPLVRDRVVEGGTGREENRLKLDTPFPFTVPLELATSSTSLC